MAKKDDKKLELILLKDGTELWDAFKLPDSRAAILGAQVGDLISVDFYHLIETGKYRGRYEFRGAYHICISKLPEDIQQLLGKPTPVYGTCSESLEHNAQSCDRCRFGKL